MGSDSRVADLEGGQDSEFISQKEIDFDYFDKPE
jgi:hypothetical protein